MELVKNIFFNTDKLTQNSTVKISYTGKFFQDNSEEVYIHYGFGLLWENLAEVKMEKGKHSGKICYPELMVESVQKE